MAEPLAVAAPIEVHAKERTADALTAEAPAADRRSTTAETTPLTATLDSPVTAATSPSPATSSAPAKKRTRRRSSTDALGLGELHQVAAELSAATAAMLSAGTDTPLLARAFRTARAAG